MGMGLVNRTFFRLQLILPAAIAALFFLSSPAEATSRGIRVISEKGKELYLYKDYHALVISLSAYACLLIGQENTKQQPLKLHI